MFQQYTASAIENIYHPSIVDECKANMENEYYKDKHDLVVYMHYVNDELSRIMNVDHWPKLLLGEIDWFQFKGIL